MLLHYLTQRIPVLIPKPRALFFHTRSITTVSDTLWRHHQQQYLDIQNHPFNQAMASGKLSHEIFHTFLHQDWHFLNRLSSLLNDYTYKGHQSKTLHPQEKQWMSKMIISTFRLELNIQRTYLPNAGSEPISSAVSNYIAHMTHTAHHGSHPMFLASLAPCFRIFISLGQHMSKQSTYPNNPHKTWIDTYNSSTFRQKNEELSGFLSLHVKTIDVQGQRGVVEAFGRSMAFEKLLLDHAWHAHTKPNTALLSPSFY